MGKSAAAVFFAVLCISFIAQAAEEPAALMGKWGLDQAKSDPFPKSQTAMNTSVGDVGRGGGGMGGMGGGMGGMRGGMPGGGFPGGMGGPGGAGGRGASGGPPTPPNVTLTIEQNGTEIKLTTVTEMGGKEFPPYVETLNCDGKQHENLIPIPNSQDKLKEKNKATFKKNKLVIEKISSSPPPQQMQTLTKRNYSVSADGKTLTLETTIENTMSSMLQKQVYNRQ
jgi:hypothetical protein